MKTLSLLALIAASLLAACAPKPDASAPSMTAGPPPPTPEDLNCRKSLTGPGKRKEGEECGGSTNLSCAEGLSCISQYKCLGAVGTCQKK